MGKIVRLSNKNEQKLLGIHKNINTAISILLEDKLMCGLNDVQKKEVAHIVQDELWKARNY